MRAVISSAPESPWARASHTKERAPIATLKMKTAVFLISKSYQKCKTKRQKFRASYPNSGKRDGSLLNAGCLGMRKTASACALAVAREKEKKHSEKDREEKNVKRYGEPGGIQT